MRACEVSPAGIPGRATTHSLQVQVYNASGSPASWPCLCLVSQAYTKYPPVDMERFGSRLGPPDGERRDNSVMSISSLINNRDAHSRTTHAVSRSTSMTNSGHSVPAHCSGGISQRLQATTSPQIRPISPQTTIKDEGDGDTDNALGAKSPSRDPRPSYSEEQKFFIMWARIVQEKGWTEIEDEFARIFNQRTKGGLTSVYYRIRKSWKLRDVLNNDPGSSDADRQAVATRALNFSRAFLRDIGYAI